MSNPASSKYCVVPKCGNTTKNAPDKMFFHVPMNVNMRKQWSNAMKRKYLLGLKSTKYCCEDHFDIENDMENYIRHKLMGCGKLKLKEGVIPHKFDCQKLPRKTIERGAYKKRRQIEYYDRVLSKDVCHEDLTFHPIEVIKCEFKDPAESNQEENKIKLEPTNPAESENVDLIESKESENIDPMKSEESKNIDRADSDSDDPFESVDQVQSDDDVKFIPVVQVKSLENKSVQVNISSKMQTKSTNTPVLRRGRKLNKRINCRCRCVCGK